MEKALRVVASPILQLSEDGKKVTRVKQFEIITVKFKVGQGGKVDI